LRVRRGASGVARCASGGVAPALENGGIEGSGIEATADMRGALRVTLTFKAPRMDLPRPRSRSLNARRTTTPAHHAARASHHATYAGTARQSRLIPRISGGYTIRCRNGMMAAM